MLSFHQKNLITIALFLLVLIGVWFVLYKRMKQQYSDLGNEDIQFNSVISSLSARERTDEELIRATTNLDFPYTICYYPQVNDPSRWIDTPTAVTSTSSILRRTKPFVVRQDEGCSGSTSIVYDFRTDASVMNESYNRRVDEIIKLFLEKLYPGIVVQQDTIIKCLTYAPTTKVYLLSVLAVYQITANNQFDVLVNQFKLSAIGGLVNDPPQSLTAVSGSFPQIVRRREIDVVSNPRRFTFVSARSATQNTLQIYTNVKFEGLINTLELNNTRSSFGFFELPTNTTRLFLNVIRPGYTPVLIINEPYKDVYLERFFTITLPATGAVQKVDHSQVIYKIFSGVPLTTVLGPQPDGKLTIDLGLYVSNDGSVVGSGSDPAQLVLSQMIASMNNGHTAGLYFAPQLTSSKMNCTGYSVEDEGKTWLNEYTKAKASQTQVKTVNGQTIGTADLYWGGLLKRAFWNANLTTLQVSDPFVKFDARNGGTVIPGTGPTTWNCIVGGGTSGTGGSGICKNGFYIGDELICPV
jgi:hypothetical protein